LFRCLKPDRKPEMTWRFCQDKTAEHIADSAMGAIMGMNEAAAQVGMDATRLGQIAPALQRFVDDGTIAGCTTLISRRGEIVHRASVGDRDREAGLAMTDDTIFRIYSMTKPIVSTALMLLWEEGRFHLNAPVATFLPAFAKTKVIAADGSLEEQAAPMTIRQLLSHTSGLTYDFLEDSPAGALYRNARIMNDATRTLEETVDAIAEIPLAAQPGALWQYSVGIDVAARIIEVLSGQSLQNFLATRLFDPLGMTETAYEVAEPNRDRLAAMYGLPDLVGPGFTATDLMTAALAGANDRHDVSSTYPVDGGPAFARGGLGLFSTIDDYHRFASMLLSGRVSSGDRIIGRKTLEMMHSNHLSADMLPWGLMGLSNPGLGFGLGSRVAMDPAATGEAGSVGEFGWAGAAKTYYWVDPAEDMVGLFMAQYMTGPVTVENTFRTLAYGAIGD